MHKNLHTCRLVRECGPTEPPVHQNNWCPPGYQRLSMGMGGAGSYTTAEAESNTGVLEVLARVVSSRVSTQDRMMVTERGTGGW